MFEFLCPLDSTVPEAVRGRGGVPSRSCVYIDTSTRSDANRYQPSCPILNTLPTMANTPSRSSFLGLPIEIRDLVFSHLFSTEPITVDLEPVVLEQSRWQMPAQALQTALTSRQVRSESARHVQAMICKNDARPTFPLLPFRVRQHLRTIILANGHRYLHTPAFPALKSIICAWDPQSIYTVRNLDQEGRYFDEFFEVRAILVGQKSGIQDQLWKKLPLWLQEVVSNPGRKFAVQVELRLVFRRGFLIKRHAWDADVDYPALRFDLHCRYDWDSGHIFDVRSL